MASYITTRTSPVTKNDKGEVVNKNGLTLEEYTALKQYEKDKESGKATQSYNASRINQGLSRDEYDSKVRGGGSAASSAEEEKDSSDDITEYLPLPGNDDSGKVTVSQEVVLPLPSSDRGSLEGNSITIDLPAPEEKKLSAVKDNYVKVDSGYTDFGGNAIVDTMYIPEVNDVSDYYTPSADIFSSDDMKAAESSLRDAELLYSATQKMLQSGKKTLFEMESELKRLDSEVDRLYKEYEADPSAAKGKAYNAAYDAYVKKYGEYTAFGETYNGYYEDYKGAYQILQTRGNEYSALATKKSEAYKAWRSTLRSPEEIKRELTAVDKAIAQLEGTLGLSYGDSAEANANKAKQAQAYHALLDYKDKITEELSYSEEIETAEFYASYTEREDFEENSQYKSTKYKESGASLTGYFDTGYRDNTYEIINGNETVRQQVKSNNTASGYSNLNDHLSFVTETERSIYNYLYATEGKTAADEFIDLIEPDLNERARKATETKWGELAKEDPVGTSFVSVILNAGKITAAIGQAADYLDDGRIDQNASYNSASHISSAIRDTVAGDLGGVGGFLYQTGMSIADFTAAAALSGGTNASLLIMGSGAAVDTTIEAKDRGIDDTEALLLGIAAGGIEALTEKVSLDAVLDATSLSKNALGYWVKNILSEGGEEISSELANMMAEALITPDKTNLSETISYYMSRGYSQKDAFNKTMQGKLVELGLAGLGGAISGGAIGAPGAAFSGVSNAITKHKGKIDIGKTIQTNTAERDILIDTALGLPDSSEAHKLAVKLDNKIKNGKTPTSKELTRLEELTEKDIEAQKNNAPTEIEAEDNDGIVNSDDIFAEDNSPEAEPSAEISEERINTDKEVSMPDFTKKDENFVQKAADSFKITKLGDYIHVKKQILTTLLKEGFFTDSANRRRTDINSETGMEIETNKSGIDETFSLDNYVKLGRKKKAAKIATVRMIPEAIKNGHMVIDDAPNIHNDGKNKTFAYIEYPTVIDGENVTLKLTIKKSPQKNKLWVHSVYTNDAGDYPASTASGTEAGYRTADTDGIIPQKSGDGNTSTKKSNESATKDAGKAEVDDGIVNPDDIFAGLYEDGGKSTEQKLTETSSIKLTQPFEEYSAEKQKTITEFVNSVDDRIVDFVENNRNSKKFSRLNLDQLSSKAVTDISDLVGFSVDGYVTAINTNATNHIEKRHGKNGAQDHTMANTEDIARLTYVIDKYDTVEILTDSNGDSVLSEEFRNADDTKAQMIKFSKKIDGTYYVVEAVPDSSYKKMWIVSAYTEKGVTQESNAANATLNTTSKTRLASPPSDIIISQKSGDGNTSAKESNKNATKDAGKAEDNDGIVNSDDIFAELYEDGGESDAGSKADNVAEDNDGIVNSDDIFADDAETAADGKEKYSIVNLDDGRVYVEASRNVIKGKTVSEQRKDISQFFSDLLDEKSSLDIPTIDGNVLTITKNETADKARDNYKTVKGKATKLTDEEFLIKLHIESHIDEIAEVSTKKSQKSDSKNHSFAKDGFTYRKAYFKDFDGKYYEVTLSIGHNGTVATVYNVGKIEEGILPSAKTIAVVGSLPLGKTPSGNSISQKGDVDNSFDKKSNNNETKKGENSDESQIYNWNIKKDATLGGVQPVVNDSSHGASSDASADSISQKGDTVNTSTKKSNESATKDAGKAEVDDGIVNPDDIFAGLYEDDSAEGTAEAVAEDNDGIVNSDDIFAENEEQTISQNGEEMYSFVGYADDGKGIYKSNFPKGTPKRAKSERILRYIQNLWSKKPITLRIDDGENIKYIDAKFDPTYSEDENVPTDASKLMGGNRHGTSSEQRVTLDLADDYYQIASESEYNYSKDEIGKDSDTHRDVKKWHYFVNDIYFAEQDSDILTPYRVSINIKEKSNGNFFYSFSAEKTEKSSTLRTLHAAVNDSNKATANGRSFDNSISQNSDSYNSFDKKSNNNETKKGENSDESQSEERNTKRNTEGDHVSDGSRERDAGERSGEQAGDLGQSTERWADILEESDRAEEIERARIAASLRTEQISSASLGIENGTSTRTLRIYPEEKWDDNLKKVADHVYDETGKNVIFVQGPIEIKTGMGKRFARGVNTAEGIIIRMNDPKVTPEQIALHEIYHDKSAASPMLNEAIKEAVIDKYSPETFEKVFEAYADKLAGVYELEDASEESYKAIEDAIIEEIFADAYGNINGFGVNASDFRETVLKVVNEESQRLDAGKKKAAMVTGNNRSEKYSFNETVSGMANDALMPYDEELKALILERGDYVVDNYDKLIDIVETAFNEPTKKATAYFGMLSPKIISDIETKVPNKPIELNKILFKTGKTYSIAITLDSIRHISEDKKGITMEDIISYLDRMPDTIINSDSVTFDWYIDGMGHKNKALLFKKTFEDGKIQTLQVISDKKRSLKLQSVYMENSDYIKKKTAKTLPMQKTSAHTPNAGASQSSTNIISEKTKKSSASDDFSSNVRKEDKYSIDDTVGVDEKNTDWIKREISAAQSKENLRIWEEEEARRQKGHKKRSPQQISDPSKSRSDLKKVLYKIFSIPKESRPELGSIIDGYSEKIIKNGKLTEADKDSLIDRLYAEGIITAASNSYFAEKSELFDGRAIYVSDEVKAAFGDRWNDFQDVLLRQEYAQKKKAADATKESYSLEDENILDLTTDNELSQRIGELRGADKYKVIQNYILEVLKDQPIVLSDGKKAIVDRRDALHMANKAANKKTAQISKIKELVQNAQLFAEDINVEHDKFDYFCYYEAPVRYEGEFFPIYLNVGRGINDGLYHIYDITNKIRDTADRINGLERPKPNEGYALTNDISNNSISQKSKKSTALSKKSKEKYSLSDITIPTYEELLAKDDMEIVDITKSYGKGRYKEQRTEFINSEEAKAILREPVVNKDTGESIFVVNSSFTHSFSNADLGAEQIAAIKNIRKIIENAVLTHAEAPTHGNESTTGVYTLFAAVKTKTGIKPTKLKIKEYRLDGSPLPQNIIEFFDKQGIKDPYASVYDNRVLVLEEDGMTTAETKKEEPSSSARPSTEKAVASSYPSGSSVISIADLLSLVNSEYQKYIPKKKESFDKFSIDDSAGVDEKNTDWIRHEPKQSELEETFEDLAKPPRKKTSPVAKSYAIDSKRDLRNVLYKIFSIPKGSRPELGSIIDSYSEKIIKNGKLTEADKDSLIDRLYAEGIITAASNSYFAEKSELFNGRSIYIHEDIKAYFGDGWNDFRSRALDAGILFSSNMADPDISDWYSELSEAFPEIFYEEEPDADTILENVVSIAEEAKGMRMSLAEFVMQTENEGGKTQKQVLDELEEQVETALYAFAQKAKLEISLRERTDIKMQQQREAFSREWAKEKQKQVIREAKRRQARLEAAERKKESENVRAIQNETIKTLQWLSRHRNKASDEYKAKFNEVISDIDIFAKSTANAMRWSDKHQATWKDIEQMYKDAVANDPGYVPSDEVQRIIARLNNRKVSEMDMTALMDLYTAAVALKTEYQNRQYMLLDEKNRTFSEIYEGIAQDMKTNKEQYNPGKVKSFFNRRQLTPMNMLQMMGDWNPDGTLLSLGEGLEQGERDVHAYIVKAGDIFESFLEKNKKWVRRSDGQGRDAIWYTETISPYLGDKYNPETKRREPQYGDPVTVHLTPSQRVYLYYESLAADNLRHMTADGGGRTFVNKELYSKGKRSEAFAQGITVRLSPETIKQIADPSKFSKEENELLKLLGKYFNNFAKNEINRVSNELYGYSRAMNSHYAQIFTNANYTKGGFDHFGAPSAEGVPNMKERMQDAVNPTYNIGAFDAFERHVNTTSKYVGLSIPVRNFKIALNWREKGNSASDRITHKWGQEGLSYIKDMITDIQSTDTSDKIGMEKFLSKLSSNYISAVFGLNPSIVTKQLGSIPAAATYLGWQNRIIPQKDRASYKELGKKKREIISLYTSELDYRTLGFSSEETKILKDNPGVLDRNAITQFALRGGAITRMDGFAAQTLWSWTENKVRREHPELQTGTKEEILAGESEFYKAVAKEFDYVVSRTQSMSDFMHQSTMRRDKSAINRAFTLFKSDAAQAYNIHRQLIGEALYLQKSGASKGEIAGAWLKVGRAILNTLLGYSYAGGIAFLINLLKYKGKSYKDDEDELTPESVFYGILEDVATSYAGIIIGGEELAGIIASVISGKFRFETQTMEMEQLAEMFNEIEEKSKLIKDIAIGMTNVGNNGGDIGEYLLDQSGEIAGAIKDIAKTFAIYLGGLPADNLEAYLLGAVKWAAPELGAAYDDFFDTVKKSDLKGLSGDVLEDRIGRVLSTRDVDISDNTAAALAELYLEGYTDVIPSATPSKMSIDTVERELSEYQRQVFDEAWSETVNGAIDKITSSAIFKNAEPMAQLKMLNKLYDYATNKAKVELFDDYEDGINTLEKADGHIEELEAMGLTSIDYFTLSGIRSYFDGLDDEYPTAKDQATAFSRWVNKQGFTDEQKDGLREIFAFWTSTVVTAGKYDDLIAAGLSDSSALLVLENLEELEPNRGRKSVNEYQNAFVAITGVSDVDTQLKVVDSFLDDNQYKKIELAYKEFYITPKLYLEVRDTAEELAYKKKGNTNISQAIAEEVLRNMNMGTGRKAILWTFLTNGAPKNNPFDTEQGQWAKDALDSMK